MGKWNSNSISIFRFSFWYDIEKQIWMLLFVFRFRLTFKNAFELRFSFFVFASLWKTDMNFVFRFHITLKNGFEFRFCMACYLKNRSEFRLLLLHDSWKTDYCTSHLKSPDTPSGFTGEFTFYAKESNWIFSSPGPKWVVNSPAPMICPPHTVLLFNKGWQIIWWYQRKKHVDFGAAIATLVYARWKKENDEYLKTIKLKVTKCKITQNYQSSFTVFWSFCRMTQLLQVSFLSSFPRYNYIISS